MSDTHEDMIAVAQTVLRREAQAILDLVPRLDHRFEEAVELLLNCEGKVIFTAVGKSGHIGRKIAATLASTGTPAFFVHPTEALHGDLGMIRPRDVVVAISHSGATAELLAVLPVLKRIGVPVIAFCQSAQTPLGRAAACCLETNVKEEADTLNLAPTASTTVTLALGDALAVALLKQRGFEAKDFALLHPGGELGRSLLTVREIMPQDVNPTVSETASAREAISTSSEANLGAVSIVSAEGKLSGILTEGDIRRLLQSHEDQDLLDTLRGPVSAVMTPSPLAVEADTRGEQAVRVMEEKSTYVLPVLETDGTAIGMVRMHDLIKAGFRLEETD